MRSLFLRRLAIVLAALAGTTAVGFAADVAFDDFEGLTMKPFDEANVTIGDGTDWTEIITGWTVTNAANHEATDAAAYNGWRAMDVDSWIEEQGIQAGRDRMQLGANNTALIADPDAWDDFPPGGKTSQGFNSYVSRSYDITGRDLATLEISFDWDFVTEDRQIGVVDVSFDGGATYQNLVTVASADWAGDATWGPFSVADQLRYTTNPNGHANDVVAQKSFVSGTDFTPPGGATSMTVRFGCILSGNDWWFAVDNVELKDTTSVIAFDDFESLTLKAFPDGGVGQPPGDGSDYADTISNWTIWNDGVSDMPTKKLYNICLEGAFNGFAAVDATSWINEQGGTNGAGGQNRDTLLGSGVQGGFPARNTILLADPDAHNDYPEENQATPPDGEKEFNSFIGRQYDLSLFQNTTVVIEFDWETRIESSQRALAQVSFDYGATWTTILDVDSDDAAKITALAPFSFGSLDLYGSYTAPTQFPFGVPGDMTKTPAVNSNAMILRFGCIDADNNWWFAVDNVKITADVQAFAMGDASGDGNVNNLDIGGFITALTNKAAFDATSPVPADMLFDFNADGTFNNLDIGGFITELNN